MVLVIKERSAGRSHLSSKKQTSEMIDGRSLLPGAENSSFLGSRCEGVRVAINYFSVCRPSLITCDEDRSVRTMFPCRIGVAARLDCLDTRALQDRCPVRRLSASPVDLRIQCTAYSIISLG